MNWYWVMLRPCGKAYIALKLVKLTDPPETITAVGNVLAASVWFCWN